MNQETQACPMTYTQVVEAYFLEHRAKLIDIAAFLDRLERSAAGRPKQDDPRVTAMQRCIELLNDGQSDRARRVLERLSDPSVHPADHPGPPAVGAFMPLPPDTASTENDPRP